MLRPSFHPFKSINGSEIEVEGGLLKFDRRHSVNKGSLRGKEVFCKSYLNMSDLQHDLEIAREFFDHSSFVQVLGACERKYLFPMMIMEIAEEDLFTTLHESPERLCNIKDIQHQIVSAVAHIHSRGVVHLDIKVENVLMFNGKKKVKLCDYGSAIRENKSNDSIPFTDGHIPPEYIVDETKQFSGDIWSLACLFYRVRCGLPFFSSPQRFPDMAYLLGTPSRTRWPKFHEILAEFPPGKSKSCSSYQYLSTQFAISSLNALEGDLLSKMFKMIPEDRITAEEILKHEYFASNENECDKWDCSIPIEFWSKRFTMDEEFDKRNIQVVFVFTEDKVLEDCRSKFFEEAHS
jgi:cyclin-dependent kinase